MRRMFLLALALLLLAPLASAQVYKWVDAKGTVHFSQTPPPPGVKYQLMHMASDTGSSMMGTPSTVTSTHANAANSDQAPGAQAPVANTPANRVELCKQLQQNMTLLNSPEALNVAGANGKPVALDAQARAQQKAQTQAQIQQFCAPPKTR